MTAPLLPPEPEKAGWHWLRHAHRDRPVVLYWSPRVWFDGPDDYYYPGDMDVYTYLCPVAPPDSPDETAAAELQSLRARLSAAEAERDAAMAELRRNRPYPDTAIAVLTQPPPSTKGMAPRDRADRLYAAWLDQVARGLGALTPSPEGDEG
jgi:hypothetical protein